MSKQKVQYENALLGLILVTAGALFALNNWGIIDFQWSTLFHLWPLILIVWGVSILPIAGWWKLGIVAVAIVLSLVLVHHQKRQDRYCTEKHQACHTMRQFMDAFWD